MTSLTQLTDRVAEEAKRNGRNPAHVVDVLLAASKMLSANGEDVAEVRTELDKLSASISGAAAIGPVSMSPQAHEAMKSLIGSGFTRESFMSIFHSAAQTEDSSVTITESPANEAEPTFAATKSVDECLAELDSLVGIEDVKRQVRALVATHQVNIEREKAGLLPVASGNHLIFLGEPGTGKTTVARIVAELYKALGLLPSDNVTEVLPEALLSETPGQSAQNVKTAVDGAMGGTLLIENAVMFFSARDLSNSFEAITALVHEVESHSDSVAVIITGIAEDIGNFLKANVALGTLFKTVIEFPSYKDTDLLEMFERFASQHGMTLGEGVKDRLLQHFVSNETHGEAGNGRYARKLFERMNNVMSERAAADGIIELHEITEFIVDDVPEYLEKKDPRKGKIGF